MVHLVLVLAHLEEVSFILYTVLLHLCTDPAWLFTTELMLLNSAQLLDPLPIIAIWIESLISKNDFQYSIPNITFCLFQFVFHLCFIVDIIHRTLAILCWHTWAIKQAQEHVMFGLPTTENSSVQWTAELIHLR